MRSKRLFLILVFFSFGFLPAIAGGKLWVGLYLGNNSSPTPSAQIAPERLAGRLHDVFGFTHYQLIKCGEIQLGNDWGQWVIPRKDFFIRLLPLPSDSGGPMIVEYEVYQCGFMVANGKYEPYDDVPLFINGPDYHHGRLIFVLDVR
ncbi:MAG TPA: hypothetical protein VL981_14755 [Candidatus Methylacidiphilales bacterium]|nr:hypothetical protein [Candidatus Methylacidiphilales bacterium]